MSWRKLAALGLGLAGCRASPPFPLAWELGSFATVAGVEKPVRVVSAPTRRTEAVADDRVGYAVTIATAQLEVGGVRLTAPVRVEVNPTTVPTGLRVSARHVGGLEGTGAPPIFTQSIELATTDASGAELSRTLLVCGAAGPPTLLPLRPLGK